MTQIIFEIVILHFFALAAFLACNLRAVAAAPTPTESIDFAALFATTPTAQSGTAVEVANEIGWKSDAVNDEFCSVSLSPTRRTCSQL